MKEDGLMGERVRERDTHEKVNHSKGTWNEVELDVLRE